MRTHSKLLGLAVIALAALILYLDWTQERDGGPLLSDLRTRPIEILGTPGTPGTAGNLLGVQTRLTPADYQSRERLQRKFVTYLDQARDQGLLNPRTVVVLPEHVGTGLFALGEKPEVQQARTLRDAMQWTALSHPWRFLRALLNNRSDDNCTEAVLRIKAAQMADSYQQIFGELARRYRVTLVAGSIVLPEPRLEEGRLRIGDGPLRQVSLTFGRDGAIIGPLQYKLHLSRYEQRYSKSGPTPAPALPTPAGRLAVLIGCDADARPPSADADFVAVLGARDELAELCTNASSPPIDLPEIRVRTFGLPWGLVGSPHRPVRALPDSPVQLTNRWLPERP